MVMQITGRDGKPRVKPFAWSYSRLKNFETCPKRSYHVDILPKGHPDKVTEPEGESLRWGHIVHEGMAKRCGVNRTPLPPELAPYEHWAQKVLAGGGEVFVEQSFTLTKQFTPAAGNFAPDVWFRAKVDFLKIVGDIALLVDWKTGKIVEDAVQLALSAAVVFATFPQVQAVRCSYIWLKDDAEGSENFMRSDLPAIWRNVWPRIEAMEQAHLLTNYPPKQSGICRRFCGVVKCPFNGGG